MKKHLYVQFGCGWSAPEKWINFDASPTLKFERIPVLGRFYTKNKDRFPKNVQFGDIVKGLPLKSDSCKAVYSSHVLEHLSFEDCRKAVKNIFKILEKGGTFRFVIPDLEYSIKKYNKNSSPDAAIEFLQETLLGREQRKRGLKGFILNWLGNSQHLWMWDYKSIVKILNEAGFTDIRKAEYSDSKDPMFKDVEAEERWKDCLGIECRKPD